MYGHHVQQSTDQPGKVANPARGQLNRENEYSPSPYAPENLVSRGVFGSPVPRQPAPYLHTQAGHSLENYIECKWLSLHDGPTPSALPHPRHRGRQLYLQQRWITSAKRTVQYSTVQYSPVQYSTVQRGTTIACSLKNQQLR